MASATGSDAENATAADIYNIVIAELRAASLVLPAIDSSPFFNPCVYREVTEGLSARGKNSWLIVFLNLFYIYSYLHRYFLPHLQEYQKFDMRL